MKKRYIPVTAALLALLTVSIWSFDSAMRRGRPTLDAAVENVILEDGYFSMTASQGGNSGTSFRRSGYEIEEDTLYVTLFSGLVYGDFRADRLEVSIQDDGLKEVRRVCLRDGSALKLIYSK